MSLAIPFSSLGNRIRCFSHVINIGAQSAVKILPTPSTFDQTERDPEGLFPTEFFEDPGNQGYIAALNTDPIKAARELVNACRASGLRKHDFLLAISEGNKLDKFSGVQLRRAQLLRDVDTRWSSTYLMIDRVLEMYPAINYYIRERQTDIPQSKLLTLDQLLVLNDIRDFLSIPHAVQELLSAQQTPTLSNVLPAYEKLIVILKGVIEDLPGLSHCILTAIFKFDEYLAKSRTAPVYGIAMGMSIFIGTSC
ncbi:hypothetical protein BV25DRAFT_1962330 [Artomyces pyxidatus]|uniref:Uncharacterized protein n=1 Tax=Artomyces pyxidatus TaxID=48021 RepID=A0ACB8SRL5_9AGAM|nr:hypothetical protein BV25DRAFT_1962330 [Artomyces pyxidatus]